MLAFRGYGRDKRAIRASAPTFYSVLSVVPFILICVVFSFIFVYMPNTKARLRSGILAGVVAGTAYERKSPVNPPAKSGGLP